MGNWKNSQSGMELSLNADKTFSLKLGTDTATGTYTIEGNKLNLIGPAQVIPYTYRIEGNTLVLKVMGVGEETVLVKQQ